MHTKGAVNITVGGNIMGELLAVSVLVLLSSCDDVFIGVLAA